MCHRALYFDFGAFKLETTATEGVYMRPSSPGRTIFSSPLSLNNESTLKASDFLSTYNGGEMITQGHARSILTHSSPDPPDLTLTPRRWIYLPVLSQQGCRKLLLPSAEDERPGLEAVICGLRQTRSFRRALRRQCYPEDSLPPCQAIHARPRRLSTLFTRPQRCAHGHGRATGPVVAAERERL